MSPFLKYIFLTLKTLVIICLLIVVFNFFFDRANQSSDEVKIEEMISDLEQKVKTVTTSKSEFEYPIQRRAAAEYTVVEKSVEDASGDQYLYICAVSAAVGMVQRAQTLINIGLDHQNELSAAVNKMLLFLAPAEALCQETRVIAVGFFVLDGKGWSGVSSGEWQWLVRTSNAKVTAQEIEATEMYLANKADFINEFGGLNYSDKLDEFVTEQLGRAPKYASPGMWNEDFIKN